MKNIIEKDNNGNITHYKISNTCECWRKYDEEGRETFYKLTENGEVIKEYKKIYDDDTTLYIFPDGNEIKYYDDGTEFFHKFPNGSIEIHENGQLIYFKSKK